MRWLSSERDASRALDLTRIQELMRGNTVIDLRNVYRPEEVAAAKLTYLGIGRV
jgi:UDPglucose 6-dehydrogenase